VDNHISDERLRDVTEGNAALNVDELISIIPEVAGDVRVQQLIASTVMVKRLVYEKQQGGRPRLLKSG
jgi:hypothetical protein